MSVLDVTDGVTQTTVVGGLGYDPCDLVESERYAPGKRCGFFLLDGRGDAIPSNKTPTSPQPRFMVVVGLAPLDSPGLHVILEIQE